MINRYNLPQIQSGYKLSPEIGIFGLVVPENTVNLIENPSFELINPYVSFPSLTGSPDSSFIEWVTTQQVKGRGCLSLAYDAPALSRFAYQTATLTSGQPYTFSGYVKAPVGCIVEGYIANNSNTRLTFDETCVIIGKGVWERFYCTLYAPSTGTYRLTIKATAALADGIFYTDCWQLENKAYPTTYVDGDQNSLYDSSYRWLGIRNDSSSQRFGGFSGGQVKRLDEYFGLQITAVEGLGLSTPSHDLAPYAQRDGSYYKSSSVASRGFSIVAQVDNLGFLQFKTRRDELERTLTHRASSKSRPIRLYYYPTDSLGNPLGAGYYIDCLYIGGLEGVSDNLYQERIGLRFEVIDIALVSFVEPCVDLSGQNESSYEVILESFNNEFSQPLSPDPFMNAEYQLDNATGDESDINANVSNAANYVKRFTRATGVTAQTRSLNNRIISSVNYYDPFGVSPPITYATGAFTADSPLTGNYFYAASYQGGVTLWDLVGTGLAFSTTIRRAILVGNILYMVSDNGNAYTWNGSSITDLSDPTLGVLNDCCYDTTNDLFYVVGAGGIAVNDGSGWVLVGVSNGAVLSCCLDEANNLYVAGAFIEIDGIPFGKIAMWNGSSWAALGSGLDSTAVRVVYNQYTREIIASGIFSTAGGYAVDRVARWNGSIWKRLNIGFNNGTIYVDANRDGRLLFSTTFVDATLIESFSDPVLPVINSVNNVGNNLADPVFELTGPMTIKSLRNITTDQEITFNNPVLLDNERAILSFQNGVVQFSSALQGNLLRFVVPSQLNFTLAPGINQIELLTSGMVDLSAFAVRYKPQFESIYSIVAI